MVVVPQHSSESLSALDLADDGSVRAARFEPPVAPDVNVCASPSIYRARFPHGGTATIRVDISN